MVPRPVLLRRLVEVPRRVIKPSAVAVARLGTPGDGDVPTRQKAERAPPPRLPHGTSTCRGKNTRGETGRFSCSRDGTRPASVAGGPCRGGQHHPPPLQLPAHQLCWGALAAADTFHTLVFLPWPSRSLVHTFFNISRMGRGPRSNSTGAGAVFSFFCIPVGVCKTFCAFSRLLIIAFVTLFHVRYSLHDRDRCGEEGMRGYSRQHSESVRKSF